MNISVLRICEKKGRGILEDYLNNFSFLDKHNNKHNLICVIGSRDSVYMLELEAEGGDTWKCSVGEAASLKAQVRHEEILRTNTLCFLKKNFCGISVRLAKDIPYKAFRSHNGRIFYFDSHLIYRSMPVSSAIGKIQGVGEKRVVYPGLELGIREPVEMKVAASRLQDGDCFLDYLILLKESCYVKPNRTEKRMDKALIFKNPQTFKEYGNYSCKYFDYLTMEVYVISAVKDMPGFCKKNREEILRRSVKSIADSKIFKTNGLTPAALILTSAKIMRGGILELTFELKKKYRMEKVSGRKRR